MILTSSTESNLLPLYNAIANAALDEKLEAKVAERTSELQLALEQLRTENAERQQIAEDLRWLASFDALTGILNRRFFWEQAQTQFALATRNYTQFSVIMLDLARVKEINDRYGHVVGDATLKHFATLCMSNAPECSLIGRLGGEELAIVLPGSDHMSAITVVGTKPVFFRVPIALSCPSPYSKR